jgi:hypothetical protein
MSISIKMRKVKKCANVNDVQSFGGNFEIGEIESKQFVSLYGLRVNVMLKDTTLRSYEYTKAGAQLLLDHIKSVESDTTYWSSGTPVTEPTGERKQKQKQFTTLDLASLGPQDLLETDFNDLAAEGKIDAGLVYFSQLRCSPHFQGEIDLGEGIKCKTVEELTAALKKKPSLADKVYPIKIIWYDDHVTTVDNRRLKAHREAVVQVRYLKTKWDLLSRQEQGHFDDQAPAKNINIT